MANDENKQKKNKRFFKDFKAELKKVIWPTPKQLVNNTVAVISIVIILAVIVFFLDVAFEALNTYGIDKIRSAVTSSSTTETENTQSESSTDTEGTENNTTTENDDDENNKTADSEDANTESSNNEATE